STPARTWHACAPPASTPSWSARPSCAPPTPAPPWPPSSPCRSCPWLRPRHRSPPHEVYRRSALAEDHDRLAARLQHPLLLKLLEHAPCHLARAADDARQLLAADLDLRTLRVRHGVRLLAEVDQGIGDAV